MYMYMDLMHEKINCKSINNKFVRKSENKQFLEGSTINKKEDYKFSTIIKRFSKAEKENIKKGEDKKEDDENKKDIKNHHVDEEIQILVNDVLTDNAIKSEEVLAKEQTNDKNILFVKENKTDTLEISLPSEIQLTEEKAKTLEIYNTETTNEINNIKYVNISEDNKKLNETYKENNKLSSNQSKSQNSISEILFSSNDEAIKVKRKELGDIDNSDLQLGSNKLNKDKNSSLLMMSENLNDNDNMFNEKILRINSNEEKDLKIDTKKQLNMEHGVFENEKNSVLKFQSNNFSDNSMTLSREENKNIKIDNSVVDNLGNEISYTTQKGLEEFSIIQQMAKSIKTNKFIDGKGIIVKLKPEYLGKMTINIQNIGDEIIARISADRENIKNTLASHIGEITTLLSEKKINIDQIIIDSAQQEYIDDKNFGNDSNNNFNMSHKNNGRDFNQNNKRNRFSYIDEEDSTIISSNELENKVLKYRGLNLYV